MRTIRWGIIGCGDVTETKSGPGFQKADHSQLVAVMRRNAALAKDYAARHGVGKWYNNAEALVADPDVDAVYIATPPSSHKEYVLMCARAGKPVYVEKPMALSHAGCLEMTKACTAAGTPLFVAYYRRALSRFRKIRELVQSGIVGDLRFVTITLHRPALDTDTDPNLNWRIDPAVSGGGYFFDLASHMLDFLDYALGPVAEVSGFAGNQAGMYPAEDIVSGSFRFSSGVQGSGVWCFSAFDKKDWTEIHGTKGKIGYVTFDDSPILLETAGGKEEFSIPYPPHVQQPLIQTVVNALNGGDQCPSSGESAARTSWVMDQLVKGYYRRGSSAEQHGKKSE